MNCANHPDIAATAYCRTCGKPLCAACQRAANGTVFCDEHAVVGQPVGGYSPYTTPYTAPGNGVSPGLAFLLGLIPGVGAIYNGQYAKGVIHVIVLGLLISIIHSGAANGFEPLFGFMIPLWFFYMAFEAYHTASKRARGEQVDEWSSLFPARAPRSSFPLGPLVLIGVGVLFLLNTLEIIRFYQLIRWWPLIPIALGAYLLYIRTVAAEPIAKAQELPHE